MNRLIVADSERDADMLYATRFFAPDAFVFLEKAGRKKLLLSELEVDRGRATAAVDEVLPMSEIADYVRKKLKKEPTFPDIIATFLKREKAAKVAVPESFPLGLAQELQARGIQLRVEPGSFWPAREFKVAKEIKSLREALKITETGMLRAFEVLAAAQIDTKKFLIWGGSRLTSERLRAEIDSAILHAGGLPANTIVAGGNQACDPHERGSGPLKANSLIILDIFPRHARHGYYGDLTRTVVRGQASHAQRELWNIVWEGQKIALRAMKPGEDGKAIQDAVKDFFTMHGYLTEQRKGRWTGFFHGLGHGLGLEIHESPRFSRTTLKPGQVITVEPGLYYHGIGGVRHEDVVAVTEKGIQMLTNCPRPLEI